MAENNCVIRHYIGFMVIGFIGIALSVGTHSIVGFILACICIAISTIIFLWFVYRQSHNDNNGINIAEMENNSSA